ncbi:mechanosensitive ion channel family protein [Reinekea marinisedimentorum]|uniref:Small-conductance mechanosensitive channel n=1 Tax=Reinekea marinisedimentorum TaxID=230495 RepID=A0A4R3I592_9GAMM|nr:mechanosensitive ion channel domain-containing protein [Reinekea marinisedimentorum]TCS41014.1 small conductance mechanosensitive channel [Reinekea marinisedimentorum]
MEAGFFEGLVDVAVSWLQANIVSFVMAIVIFIVGRWIANALAKLVNKMLIKAKVDEILANFLTGIVKAILIIFVIIAALSQLGIDTTSLSVVIGAAGLAIGMALKDSLNNFASGVMLILFRPFKAGDFVEAGGVAGIVETITVFSTTMRTGDNKEVIVPNGGIYGGTITNYSARDTRRIDMVFGIGYDSDLLKAKSILMEMVAADERILKDPAPVVAVSELADSSVNFVVRPWVKSGDYWAVLWDMQEKVKLRFDKEGISIPFPQMDVHVNQVK